MIRFFRLLATLLALVACQAGCGGGQAGKTGPGAGGTPTGKEGLSNLEQMLKSFDSQKKSPPAKIADVEKVEPLFPGAYIALVQGNIVYTWGKSLSASGADVVLAHEKKVPESGGYVLMQDGTVKEMSASEFGSAKKAK